MKNINFKKIGFVFLTILSVLFFFVGGATNVNQATALPSGALIANDFDFTTNVTSELSKLIYDVIPKYSILTDVHDVIENVVTDDKIGFVGELNELTVADPGCDNRVATTPQLPNSYKEWSMKKMLFFPTYCLDDLDNTLFAYLRNTGIKEGDFTQGRATVIQKWLVDFISRAVVKDRRRIVEFAQTGIAKVGYGGILTPDSVDATVLESNYNMMNGMWYKIIANCNQYPARYNEITRNSALDGSGNLTYESQKFTDADVTGLVMYKLMMQMIKDADSNLLSQPGVEFRVSRTVYYQLLSELSLNDKLQASWEIMQNGTKVLKVWGIPVIEDVFIDDVLRRAFNTGVYIDKPHRITLQSKYNVPVATGKLSDTTDFLIWYEKLLGKVCIQGAYKMDTLILKEQFTQAAF